MSNGDDMLKDAEFENQMDKMGDDPIKLIKFTARQVHTISKVCPVHTKDIADLKKRKKREIGLSGGGGAAIGAFVMGIIEYILRRGS